MTTNSRVSATFSLLDGSGGSTVNIGSCRQSKVLRNMKKITESDLGVSIEFAISPVSSPTELASNRQKVGKGNSLI